MLKGPITLDFDQLEITYQKTPMQFLVTLEKKDLTFPLPYQPLLTLVVSIYTTRPKPAYNET